MNEDNLGFVIESRSILKNEWYTEPITMHLMRHCRLRANFEDTKWRGIQIKRGQFVTSLKTLSTETGLTIKQVRSALEKLEKTGYVASEASNKNRIITVLFYSEEQNVGKQNGKQKGNQKANKGQAKGKQRATDNNNNNGTMKTSGDLCPTGTKSPHGNNGNNASAPDIAPGGESVLTRQPVEPLTFKEWLDYCYVRNVDKGEIPNKWFELHHGADLTEKQVVRIREIIRDGH